MRDRQKLKERIDQLRVADARLLMPILTAREQHQKLVEGESTPGATAGSPAGENDAGIKPNLGADAAQTMSKLEHLRTELLEEAHETLKRYDVLLAPTETLPTTSGSGKRKAGDAAGDDPPGGASKPIRSISVSGAFATKKAGAAAQANRSASATTPKEKKGKVSKSQSPSSSSKKRLSLGGVVPPKDPKPFKPEDGPVRAENTYANIHARTSGGRFAPKSALSGAAGSTSKINTKGKWKKEPKDGEASTKRSRSRPSKSGSSKADADSEGSKRKRVKIILSKRQKANQGAAANASSSEANAVDTKPQEEEEEEEEEEVLPEPQRAALTLEEAQALLAKAMEDDDEDEEIEMQVKHEDSTMSG